VFVLDKDGIVRYRWGTENPSIPQDHEAVLEEVRKLAE